MFSVVIPLYNKAHVIERTLSTVLTQTFSDFEVIIVNDGSTDDSVKKIMNFTNDHRIRIIEQENQGVSVARNKGVANSKFDYVAFLDADDEWMPGFLEKMKEAIELFPNAGMYGSSSYHRDYKTGFGHDSTVSKYKYKIEHVGFYFDQQLLPHTSAMVVSKKIFNQIADNGEGFPVGMKVCEDWSCFYRMSFIAHLVYVGFPLGIRNNNVGGQITALSPEKRLPLFRHVCDYYNITYKSWLNSNPQNKKFIKFLKFDIRGRMVSELRDNDYSVINIILEGLDNDILKLFWNIELTMYKIKTFRILSILYIYFTKINWRIQKLFVADN